MKLYTSCQGYDGYPFYHLWPDVIKVDGTDPWDLELLEEPGVVVLWGGEDISPSIYGEKRSKYTGAKDEPSRRDLFEIGLYKKAVELGYPIIGICRGAQLACALNGGKVIQHVENHGGRSHKIRTNDDRTFVANSLHHQMMLLPEDAELIAWADPSLSSVYIGEDNVNELRRLPEGYREPEAVYFEQTKTLGIQGHPEFIGNPDDPFVQYCLELAANRLG